MGLATGTANRNQRMTDREGKTRERPARRLFSPLTLRILAINVLALAIPVVGLLYLGPYQDGLLETELEAMRTQADIFAGALGEGAIQIQPNGVQVLNVQHARNMIRRLTAATPVRARLFLTNGELIADSRQVGGRGRIVQIFELPPPPEDASPAERLLQLVDWFFDVIHGPSELEIYRELPNQSIGDYPEALRALGGEPNGVVRADSDGGFVLSVAMPVQRYHQVIGVMMLSKNGAEVQAAVRNVRLVVMEIFAIAMVVTVLLSFYLASAIARPVRRLAEAAMHVRRGVGRELYEIPDLTKRGDEIGDLSGALREMTDALYLRLNAIERFAADVSHEIKNPLTSLRSAVETASRLKDPDQQQKLMTIIQEDVHRLDRLITDISDYSRLDAELSREELAPVDVGEMMNTLVDIHCSSHEASPPRVVTTVTPGGGVVVSALEGRLVQVFQNLLANAEGFAPPGTQIQVNVSRAGNAVEVTVKDCGPGLPEGKLEAVFDRFYTERPEGEKFGMHSGLGLSISRQIVDAHGGTITADNWRATDGQVGGAVFTVRLPAV